MKLEKGKIGSREIAKSISELKERTYIRNLWIHTTHNNYVTGREYNELIELVDDDLEVFYTLDEYYEECKVSYREVDQEIEGLLENGATVYIDLENDRFSSDEKEIVEFIITDGHSRFYSYDQAMENLQSDYVDEALVIYLLK